MGTSVILAELEVGSAVRGNTALDDLAVAVAQALIFFKSRGIYIDFPTDAAAVRAFVSYALEVFVICRGVKLHDFASLG